MKCRSNALEEALSQGRVTDIFIETAPTATFYALAVLDRNACVKQLKPQISRLDHQLKELVSRFEKTDLPIHPPDGYALMDPYLCREALDTAMSAATPAGKGMPLPVQPKTVRRLLRKN